MTVDEALEELVTAHGDRLLRFAYQLTHDRFAAQDVVQEALMTMCRSWRRRTPLISNVEAYARRAVLNEFLRGRRQRAATEVVTANIPDVGDTGFEEIVVDRDAVWAALGALPARQRTVLVLRCYEDLPDTEIARLIGARRATVRSLAARGIAALHASVSEALA